MGLEPIPIPNRDLSVAARRLGTSTWPDSPGDSSLLKAFEDGRVARWERGNDSPHSTSSLDASTHAVHFTAGGGS